MRLPLRSTVTVLMVGLMLFMLSDRAEVLGEGRIADLGVLDPVGKLAGEPNPGDKARAPDCRRHGVCDGPVGAWWSRSTLGIPQEYLP